VSFTKLRKSSIVPYRRPPSRSRTNGEPYAGAKTVLVPPISTLWTGFRATWVNRGGAVASPRQRLGPDAAPRDRRLEVVARERLALVAERFGFGGPTQRQERDTEECPGARRVDPALFDRVRWGTAAVLVESRERIRALGWRHVELATLWDVDRPDDLERVRREVAGGAMLLAGLAA